MHPELSRLPRDLPQYASESLSERRRQARRTRAFQVDDGLRANLHHQRRFHVAPERASPSYLRRVRRNLQCLRRFVRSCRRYAGLRRRLPQMRANLWRDGPELKLISWFNNSKTRPAIIAGRVNFLQNSTFVFGIFLFQGRTNALFESTQFGGARRINFSAQTFD